MQSNEEIRELILKLTGKSESTTISRIEIDDSGKSRIPDVALAMLNEDEPDAVNAALIVLRNFSRHRGKEYLEKAMALLDQPSYAENVMELIQKYGDASYIPKVIKFLNYPMPEIRRAAIQTIERFNFGTVELHETALAMISDSDENVRMTLIVILRRSKDPKIVSKLISMMYNDVNYDVRKTAAYSLIYNNDPEGQRLARSWIETNMLK